MTDPGLLDRVHRLRASYRDAASALPWLDAARCDGDAPLLSGATDSGLPAAPRVPLEPGLRAADHPGSLVVYDPDRAGPIDALHDLLDELAAAALPLVVLHTDLDCDALGALARRHPRLQIVVESGPVKILYFIDPLRQLLLNHPNVWLCTWNLCNWLGIETLCAAGLGDRLLFGTHAPRFSAQVSMGPIVMGHLPWRDRCGIAGDNLRRLLGLPEVAPSVEVAFEPGPPLVIDAHGHSGPPGRFPTPDENFAPADWLRFMDACAIDQLYLCPIEAIYDPALAPRDLAAGLLAAAPGRFRYFELFCPGAGPDVLARIERSLRDPACAGIKIHPTFHAVAADDDSYAPVFEIAERTGAAILTHTWEAAPTNPDHHLSLPERFERHLREHPTVRLVLGHAGGRPSTLESVVDLCARYPGASVDIAGDYFDSGLVETLCERIGAGRVLFASDVNWIDPRPNLAAVLAANISDEDALRILRTNAEAVYASANR